jgi:hypothetical protein
MKWKGNEVLRFAPGMFKADAPDFFSYALLCSRLVWDFAANFGGLVTWPLSNAYVWISIALLVLLPIRQPAGRQTPDPPAESPRLAPLGAEGESHVGELDREFAGLLDGVRAPAAVRSKPVPVVKAERPGVGR